MQMRILTTKIWIKNFIWSFITYISKIDKNLSIILLIKKGIVKPRLHQKYLPKNPNSANAHQTAKTDHNTKAKFKVNSDYRSKSKDIPLIYTA